MITTATAQPRRRIRQFCRYSTSGFKIKATNPATTIRRMTSRSRYSSCGQVG